MRVGGEVLVVVFWFGLEQVGIVNVRVVAGPKAGHDRNYLAGTEWLTTWIL